MLFVCCNLAETSEWLQGLTLKIGSIYVDIQNTTGTNYRSAIKKVYSYLKICMPKTLKKKKKKKKI